MQQFLNIPYYSALLDSSTSPSSPVTPMNDSNMNEEILGDAARQPFLEQLFQYTPFNMVGAAAHGDQAHPAAAAQFVSISPHAVDPYSIGASAGSTSTPAAMLHLLTALNGDHQHYQQLLNLSAPAPADYGPATLNFFQASSATDQTAHLHHAGLAAQINDHNSLQLGHGLIAGPPAPCSSTSGFLSLFNLHDEMRPPGSVSAAAGNLASASPCLQLQPLELHPALGSPSTLFQKRAAQRRQHGSPVQGATSTGTSSSASSKAKLLPPLMNTSTPLNARNSSCSFSSSHKEWTTKQLSGSSSSAAVALSSDPPLEAGQLEKAGLSEAADGGDTNLGTEIDYSRREQRGLPPASDQEFSLAAEDEDNCAEALFRMHDPELQRMEAVHGESSLMHDHTSEDDELLLLQSAGGNGSLQLAAPSNEQHNIQDTATIPRGNGRGKAKGPPAKNLMAERRRRKKLNDRLYTLRSVVPKISKMDRASILGDAIEYLKELLQRINDLHNELEASSTPSTAPMPTGFPPATPNSFANQSSSLTPTTSHTANLPANSLVKLEDCPSATSSQLQLQSVCAAAGPGPDPSQPPKIEVRTREGRALNIHMFCGRRPGLLLAIMRALDGLGLDVQQAVISCFNGFALDVFRAEQSQEEEVAAEEIKRVLLHTATSTSALGAGSGGSY